MIVHLVDGRVKRSASRHGESVRRRTRGGTRTWKKWLLILFVALLLIPAMQVAVVRVINPPLTLPMLIDRGSAMFLSVSLDDLEKVDGRNAPAGNQA